MGAIGCLACTKRDVLFHSLCCKSGGGFAEDERQTLAKSLWGGTGEDAVASLAGSEGLTPWLISLGPTRFSNFFCVTCDCLIDCRSGMSLRALRAARRVAGSCRARRPTKPALRRGWPRDCASAAHQQTTPLREAAGACRSASTQSRGGAIPSAARRRPSTKGGLWRRLRPGQAPCRQSQQQGSPAPRQAATRQQQQRRRLRAAGGRA